MIAERTGARRVALASLGAATTLAVLKLAVALATGSIAVLSDALQAALDVALTGVTLYAVRLADKPPDREHPYGHGRAENLAALAQAVLLLLLGAGVGWEALRRLTEGHAIAPPGIAVAIVAASLVVDFARATLLRRAARRYNSQALEADSLNFSADVLGSVAVLAALVLARAGVAAADPVAALVVVALVWAMGARLAVSAVNVLMDRAPHGLDEELRRTAGGVEGVIGVEDVRVRRSGPRSLADLTVRVGRTSSVERSHEIAESVRDRLAEDFPGTSATVRVEPTEEGEDVLERVFAAATRTGLADQIHNVLAIRHPEGLWLMLHAKVDPATPLADAHVVTDELEVELRREIGSLARVEIHLEPRESQHLSGRVVTVEHDLLVREAATIAERHPPIERCHEVAVSEVAGHLHVVLHCEAGASCPIDAIHAASLKVEDEIHRTHPDVSTVTIHFEPSTGR